LLLFACIFQALLHHIARKLILADTLIFLQNLIQELETKLGHLAIELSALGCLVPIEIVSIRTLIRILVNLLLILISLLLILVILLLILKHLLRILVHLLLILIHLLRILVTLLRSPILLLLGGNSGWHFVTDRSWFVERSGFGQRRIGFGREGRVCGWENVSVKR